MSGVVTATVAVGAISAKSQADAAAGAASAQAAAGRRALSEEQRQFDITQAQLDPFRLAGEAALTEQQALLGLSGVEAQQAAFDAFAVSPGQQFMQQRQEEALLRSQAATGGLGGGQVLSALQQQAAGFAQTDLQNQLAQLSGLSQAGQSAAVQTGTFGAQAAGAAGRQLTNIGQAQAGGILGAGAAQSQFIGQAGGALISAIPTQQAATTQPVATSTLLSNL